MNQQKPITLIIEAKDGSKYQGNFISKDTEKLTITLSDVTKTFEGKEEKLLSYEIKKEDITKISMIENTQQKEEVNNKKDNIYSRPKRRNSPNSYFENQFNIKDAKNILNINYFCDKNRQNIEISSS